MVKTKLVEELHRIAGDGKGGFIITHGSEMQIECLVVFIESLLADARSESYTNGYRDGYDQQKKELMESFLKVVEEDITRNQERGFPTSAVAKQWVLTQIKHYD